MKNVWYVPLCLVNKNAQCALPSSYGHNRGLWEAVAYGSNEDRISHLDLSRFVSKLLKDHDEKFDSIAVAWSAIAETRGVCKASDGVPNRGFEMHIRNFEISNFCA